MGVYDHVLRGDNSLSVGMRWSYPVVVVLNTMMTGAKAGLFALCGGSVCLGREATRMQCIISYRIVPVRSRITRRHTPTTGGRVYPHLTHSQPP